MADPLRLGIDFDVRCVACGRERGLGGTLILEGERTMVVEQPQPCPACGERRAKVTVDVGESRENGTETQG